VAKKKGMTTNFFFTPLFCCCFGSGIRDINIPDPQHCGAQVDRYNITITSVNLNSLNILAKLEPKSARTLEGQFFVLEPMICRYIDEGVVGSGMGLFLIVGHWPKILPQNSKGAS
jgi:hypothetical protein